MDNPRADGWNTEVLGEQAEEQLKALGKLIVHPEQLEAARLEALVVPESFRCDRLVPESLEQVFEDSGVVVERLTSESSAPGKFSGIGDFKMVLRQAAAEVAGADDARFEVKIVGVEPAGNGFSTRQYFSLSGVTAGGMVEHHATWRADWESAGADAAPRMRRLVVERFERIRTRGPARPLFADCTEAALRANPCYAEQLLRGANHWLARMPDRATGNFYGMPGLAVGDVNGDGLDDLYLCQDPGLPNKLFLQQPDGTLRDVARQWEVDWLEDSRSALLVDLDNDGDQDLAVSIFGHVVLARNADGRFEIQDVLPCEGSNTSLAAIDYDQDSRLDVFVCRYGRGGDLTGGADPAGTAPELFFDSESGLPNKLFRNLTTREGWKFEDVTRQVGLEDGGDRRSFAAAWEDFDNDGDPDLCVANDFGPNNLFQHDQVDGEAKFSDVAAVAAAEDVAFGMSASWGDYDRDGWMDLYIANMFSSAGQRVTSQAQFKPEASSTMREAFRRLARGNTLLRNHGPAAGAPPGARVTFRDRSVEAGVTMGRWAWGSNFVDVNNDGWEDLVVANGYITGEDPGDL